MSFKEITIAILSIILSVGCAKTNFDSSKRAIKNSGSKDPKSAVTAKEDPSKGVPVGGFNPEDPNVIIDNLSDGMNIGELVGGLLGGIGGLIDSIIGNPEPEIPDSICDDKLNIIMVVDASDSMDMSPGARPGQTKKIDTAKSVIKSFINDLELKTGDQVGLVAYHQRVLDESTAMSSSKDAVTNKISTLETFKQPDSNFLQHNTNMSEGLRQAARMINEEEGYTNVVVLLSDGFPNLPRGDTRNPFDNEHAMKEAGKAARDLRKSDTIVFSVGFDFENDGDLLKNIASKGDYHFKASNAQSLKVAYDRIESNLCRSDNSPSN